MSVKKDIIQTAKSSGPMFNSWENKTEFEFAMSEMNKAFDTSSPLQRSQAFRMSFRDIQPNTSVRTGFNRGDYNYFRPDEAIPVRHKDILALCQTVYQNVPIVKQIVDLMGDFATKGIRVVHRNPEQQKYYEAWWDKVNGKYNSERIANIFLRLGVAYIRRHTVKLTERQQKKIYRSQGEVDMDYDDVYIPEDPSYNEIPLKYTLYDPLVMENLGGALSKFAGESIYALVLPHELKNRISRPNPEDAQLIKLLPKEIVDAARSPGGRLVIPMEKLTVLHYKKDDWSEWAHPMIYPILKDIIILEKMKLADQSALDGIISKVRVWKLGSLEHKIVPGPDAISKFSEFMLNNVGGGAMDIVWGPAIELLETKADPNSILGEEKYKPILSSIYAGLGVPPTLTGMEGKGSFTNNAVSLKTLIERLQYIRDVLVGFWSAEIENVRKAKGFRFGAQLQFDKTILTDESSEKALYIQLVDRDIISYESIRERFGEIPELEERRVRREHKDRDSGKNPPRSNALTNVDNDLKKIALQTGIVTPSEVGLELDEKKAGEKNLIQQTPKPTGTNINIGKKPKKKAGQGRPQGKKDGKKRKTKKVKPIRGVASTIVWATQAQKKVSEILTPALLNVYGKKNARQLTQEEFNQAEQTKFAVFSSFKPFEEITEEKVVSNIGIDLNEELLELTAILVKDFVSKGREPTIDELRDLQSIAYAADTDEIDNNDDRDDDDEYDVDADEDDDD